MNVTFHALGSFAAAAVLSLKSDENWISVSALKKYAVGFCAGILVHGILDFLPHNYPLSSKFDVIFALVLFLFFLLMAQKQNRLLVLVCFVGAIFPDLIDLSAAIADKHLGIPVSPLSFKIFPWHWKDFSGSVYDDSRNLESNIYHLSFLLVCFYLIYMYRKKFLRF